MEVDDDTSTNHSHTPEVQSSHTYPFTIPSHPMTRRVPSSFQMPAKYNTINPSRRSSSGIFITSMFSSRYRHLQKLHTDSFLGLNSICLGALPVGAVFRSSLPATPVATPIHRESFQQFTEQAIRDRLCKTPSPRKSRAFLGLSLNKYDYSQGTSAGLNFDMSGDQPMDITSPSGGTPITEPVPESAKEE